MAILNYTTADRRYMSVWSRNNFCLMVSNLKMVQLPPKPRTISLGDCGGKGKYGEIREKHKSVYYTA